MLDAIKGGRSRLTGLAKASPPSLGEAKAGCMEETALQLGLRCLEGLTRRRKGIAGGSEGGGEWSPVRSSGSEPTYG